MDSKKKQFAIVALRKASYRWLPRSKAAIAARIGRNQYTCAVCKETFPRKGIQIDHVSPCIPVEGWDGFDGYIDRLFCEKEGLQVLCRKHHKEKTLAENKERNINKRKKKNGI